MGKCVNRRRPDSKASMHTIADPDSTNNLIVDRLVIVIDAIFVFVFRNEQRRADFSVNTVAIEQPVRSARIQPRDDDQVTTDTL